MRVLRWGDYLSYSINYNTYKRWRYKVDYYDPNVSAAFGVSICVQ